MDAIVTVYFFAYNHEKYIAKGIDSVLAQKTTYPYKIIVVDDCSTDKTPDVVHSYELLYPGIVSLKRTEVNHGLNWQFEHALLDTDTKYYTITGGDDYWLDENKLQNQLDYLEKNEDTSIVLTRKANVIEGTDLKYESGIWRWNMPDDRIDRLIDVFLDKPLGGYPAYTTSCTRTDIVKKCLKEHPELIRSSVPGEGTTMTYAVCMYGSKIVCLDNVGVAYLIRKNSLSHHADRKKQIKYEFSYTELRLNILHKLVSDEDKLYQIAKELLTEDMCNAFGCKELTYLSNLIQCSALLPTEKELYQKIQNIKYLIIYKRKAISLIWRVKHKIFG